LAQRSYPEGSAVPRSLTPAERAYLAEHPLTVPSTRGPAPGVPVRTPAEYDPMEGIVLAYEGDSSWLSILHNITREITTTGGGKVWMVVDSTTERSTAQTALTSAGANMSRVIFVVRTTDTIWIRDYGPRVIYLGVDEAGQGGVRAIIDHTYNRPRPNDNALNDFLASQWDWPQYDIPLVHGGGNYHLSSGAPGVEPAPSFATVLIANENPSLTQTQIRNHWRDFQNVETTLTAAYPSSVDSTQHIDMWMQIIGDRAAVVSNWPLEPGSTHDSVSDGVAASLIAQGWTVTRTPAFRSGFTHYTYTNVILFNDLVLIPSYTQSQASSTYNAQALAAWQAAMPGKTIRQINAQAIVTAAGVLHCIMMHVPATSTGDGGPAVHVTSENADRQLAPGDAVLFSWLSDDDAATVTYDFDFSLDNGQTWQSVVTAQADTGGYYWTVPDVTSSQVRARVTVRDAQGNTGADLADGTFTIVGTPCPADLTGDGVADSGDLGAFVAALVAGDLLADFTGDGTVDSGDLGAFVAAFLEGC
jgi:agmatine/peptidylarginine deiminase